MKPLQKLAKISELFVLEKKGLENQENHYIIKDLHSTELFQILWLKEEISQIKMELEVKVYMVLNSKMKTLLKNTPNQDYFLWQTLDQTLMVHNSLLLMLFVLG